MSSFMLKIIFTMYFFTYWEVLNKFVNKGFQT